VERQSRRMLIDGTALYEQPARVGPGRSGREIVPAREPVGRGAVACFHERQPPARPKPYGARRGTGAIGEGRARLRFTASDVLLLPDAAVPWERAHGPMGPGAHRGRRSPCGRASVPRRSSTDVRIFSAPPCRATSQGHRLHPGHPRRPTTRTTRSSAPSAPSVGSRRARFEERFGCRLIGANGSTTGGMPSTPSRGCRPGVGKGPAGTDARSSTRPAATSVRRRCSASTDSSHPEAAIGEIVKPQRPGSLRGLYENADAEADRLRGGCTDRRPRLPRREGIFYFAGRSGDAARRLGEHGGGPHRAVLAATNTRPWWRSMRCLTPTLGPGDGRFELVDGGRLDPVDFAAWLVAQPDLGAKWVPRYVRVTAVIPARPPQGDEVRAARRGMDVRRPPSAGGASHGGPTSCSPTRTAGTWHTSSVHTTAPSRERRPLSYPRSAVAATGPHRQRSRSRTPGCGGHLLQLRVRGGRRRRGCGWARTRCDRQTGADRRAPFGRDVHQAHRSRRPWRSTARPSRRAGFGPVGALPQHGHRYWPPSPVGDHHREGDDAAAAPPGTSRAADGGQMPARRPRADGVLHAGEGPGPATPVEPPQ